MQRVPAIKNRERERGYMSFPFFCRIVDEAADIGVRRIFLYLAESRCSTAVSATWSAISNRGTWQSPSPPTAC